MASKHVVKRGKNKQHPKPREPEKLDSLAKRRQILFSNLETRKQSLLNKEADVLSEFTV